MQPPEEVKRELVRQWLAKAEQDFGLAEHLVAESSPYLLAVGFHAQQAAEKFVKAFLVHHQCAFPKTHDIDQLLDRAATVDWVFAESLRAAVTLNPYAVDERYPGDYPDVTESDATEALALARLVRDAVLGQGLQTAPSR
jgi:HEPN domain-containing protein